jgi:hypothetical protein
MIPSRSRDIPALVAALFMMTTAIPTLANEVSTWPKVIASPEARILVYQPQPDSQEGDNFTGRAAVSITPNGKTEPVFGTIWLKARMNVDKEERTVEFEDVTVPKVRFPGSTPEAEEELATLIEKEIPRWHITESLDRLIASLAIVEKEKAYAEGFSTKPPKIFIEKTPTILVLIDGEPVMRKVEGTENLQKIVNTPFFLVFDGKDYFLDGGAAWFSTEDLMGEWKPEKKPSKEVLAFYEKAQPQEQKSSEDTAIARPPKILVWKEPAELIVTQGEPKYAPITGTELLYVTNTRGDIILDTRSQESYVLLSGRWFKSKAMKEPWEFVKPDALPADFAKIAEPSPKGSVLASVAGTAQADDALVDAQVPQTAAIKRGDTDIKVEYDGEPQFEKIPHTEVSYAVNTANQVLRIKGKYYLCDQAVWYVGSTPDGPWIVADEAPPEVQEIPPDSPPYNTKYVYVYDSTPEVVYVGYLPGYVGCYPYYGTIVWGTGWYYPPYISPYAYYPYPWTFGFGAHYYPYSGWSLGFSFWTGPFTFSFWGGGPYWGYYGPVYRPPYYYYGGRSVVIANPRRGGYRSTPYGTNHNVYNRPENRRRIASTTDKTPRPRARPAAGASNNVYTDRNGNVYRRNNNGSWQTRDGNSWRSTQGTEDGAKPSAGSTGAAKPPAGASAGVRPPAGAGTSARPPGGAKPPAGTARGGPSNLNRDYRARQRGSQNAQKSQQSRGGARSAPKGGGGRKR